MADRLMEREKNRHQRSLRMIRGIFVNRSSFDKPLRYFNFTFPPQFSSSSSFCQKHSLFLPSSSRPRSSLFSFFLLIFFIKNNDTANKFLLSSSSGSFLFAVLYDTHEDDRQTTLEGENYFETHTDTNREAKTIKIVKKL